MLTHDTASVIDSVYFTPCRVSFGVSWRLSETERNETTRSIHMATTIKLEGEARSEFGKGVARRLRVANKIPATIYAGGEEPAS